MALYKEQDRINAGVSFLLVSGSILPSLSIPSKLHLNFSHPKSDHLDGRKTLFHLIHIKMNV